jgi:hypothetical protein
VGLAYAHSGPIPASRSSIPVHELGTVALLFSESAFADTILTRIYGFRPPFLLSTSPTPSTPVSSESRTENLCCVHDLFHRKLDVQWERGDPSDWGG